MLSAYFGFRVVCKILLPTKKTVRYFSPQKISNKYCHVTYFILMNRYHSSFG